MSTPERMDDSQQSTAAPQLAQGVTVQNVVCATCGAAFEAQLHDVMGYEIRRQNCDGCIAEWERRMAERGQVREPDRELAWSGLCDPEYRTTEERGGATDLSRLQRECPRLREILGWEYGPEGLLVRGETGRCKTRAMWRLLRRLWEDGRTIAALSSGEFGRQFADACGQFTRKAWFDRLSSVEVLFLDDLGKSEWTLGAWGEFFELVEARVKRHRPLLVTTNETGESLGKKCRDAVTWEPLQRRLREHCRRVVL